MVWLFCLFINIHGVEIGHNKTDDIPKVEAIIPHQYASMRKCEEGAKHARRDWLRYNPAKIRNGHYTLVTVCTTMDQPTP